MKKKAILIICGALSLATANPVVYSFLGEFSTDPDTVQWLELDNAYLLWYDSLCPCFITTSTSCCTLDRRTHSWYVVIDSAKLADGTLGHGKFRLNPAGDSIRLTGAVDERVVYPVSPTGRDAAPAPPRHGSVAFWEQPEPPESYNWYVDSTPTPGQPNNDCSVISGCIHGAFSQVFDSVVVSAAGINGHCNCFPHTDGVYSIGGLGQGKYAVTADGRYQGYEYRGMYPESVEVGYSQTRSGTDFGINSWPWTQRESVPSGPKKKKVKEGGCLACLPVGDTDFVYALKGGKTCEFYRYNPLACAWVERESVPATGRTGFNLPITKGAAMTAAGGRIYVLKGSNTADFYQYDPAAGNVYSWQQMLDLPYGACNVKCGSGLAPVTIGETTWVYCLKGSGTSEFYRYNTITNVWQQMASPPPGLSAKAFGKGSCITSDGADSIWALKGRYDELYAYDAASDEWTYKDTLPFKGRSGKKKKASDGAALAYGRGSVYAFKGGSTVEFWRYDTAQNAWHQQADMPLPPRKGKKVKAGGALVYAPDVNALYALKGGGTREFWSYTLDSFASPPTGTQTRQYSVALGSPRPSLRISPNPPGRSATISYEVPVTGRVTLSIYDLSGKRRSFLADRVQLRGSHQVTWNVPSVLTAGIYFIRLDTQGGGASQKIVLTR